MSKDTSLLTAETVKQSSKLRYQKAIDIVASKIQGGDYAPGEKLPAMKDISNEMGIHFLTLRKALAELEKRGMVEIRHGAGTFVAKNLISRKKTIKIGLAHRSFLLKVDRHHPAVGAYFAGAYQCFNGTNYVVQPIVYSKNTFIKDVGRTILEQDFSGVVLFDGGVTEEDYDFLHKNNIYAVDCKSGPKRDDWLMTVTSLREGLLRQAVEHLKQLGHSRIAFVTYKEITGSEPLNRIFAQIALEHRLGNVRDLMVEVENIEDETLWEQAENVFDLNPLPTAIITIDEFMADIIIDACERRAIKIPEQLSLVAIQDSRPLGHKLPLTGANGSEILSEISYRACELLMNRINGQEVDKPDITLNPRLLSKASTGPLNLYANDK